jgi:hypothetical protein
LIEHIQEELESPATREQYREHPQDFTRKRLLSFGRVALLILRGHKLSLQNALNKCFSALGEVFRVPNASAYCHARQKLKPELFARLNQISCQDFYQLYEADGLVKRWRGHRLLGADGTYLNLPDSPETRAEFTLQTNQHEGGECVQALACVLYDLHNDLGLAAALGKRQGEKKLLFDHLWSYTEPGDVLVMDRAYADYAIFAFALKQGREVVTRVARRRFNAFEPFWESEQPEQLIRLRAPASAREFVLAHQLPEEITLRLIRVLLESGETEVLATTLLDRDQYPAGEFKQVYGWRWGEETFFDRFKNIFEVERFSGTTVTAIKQDFQGALFLASLESILSKPDQVELESEAEQRQTKTVPQVNRAVSYVALTERVVQLLLSTRDVDRILAELHHLFQTNPTRSRPDRRVQRPKLKYAHKLRFHKYVKKLTA